MWKKYRGIRYVSLVLAFLATLAACTQGRGEEEKLYATPYDLPEGFTITAHSGALHTRDNRPESIRKSIEAGADIIEMDISFRPDGTAVMKHKEEPNRFQGVLLEEGLAEVAKSDTCQINLDLKAFENLARINELVAEYGLTTRVFFTGVEEASVARVKAESSIPYYLNQGPDQERRDDPTYAQELADKIIALGGIGINCNHLDMSKTIVEVLHRNGLLVSLYTINKAEDLCRALALGPDNITTKEPTLLMQIISDWKQKAL